MYIYIMIKDYRRSTVYGLMDPRDFSIRYIGCTEFLMSRYKQHIQITKNPKSDKDVWILELRSLDLVPLLIVLEECKKCDALFIEKKYYLKYCKQFNLLQKEPTVLLP